jgi:hypothetical protein
MIRSGNAGPSVDIYFHSGVWVSFNINRNTAGCVISPDEARAAYLKLAGLTQEVCPGVLYARKVTDLPPAETFVILTNSPGLILQRSPIHGPYPSNEPMLLQAKL